MQGSGKSAGTRPDRGLARTGLEVVIYCSLLAAMVFVPSAAQAQVSRTDSLALVAIYDATDGDNWTDNTNWKSQEPVEDWYGVTVENGVVTELDLEDNNLTGTLPSAIGDLTSLEVLWLSINSLSGAIPTEIGNLTRLETLELGDNLTGAIPTEIGNLTRLEELSLGSNLTGAIPAEIGNLTNLRWLSLGGNLTGAIPTEIGNLTRLEELWLPDNSLTGSIPAEIGNLISLTNLQLHSNSLTGAIPAEIGDLTNLLALDLSQNDLSGDIPAEIGNLTRLRSLGLWNNSLTGAIPAEIGDLTSLVLLQFNSNLLSGDIPAEIGKMTSLQRLSLYDNFLSGAMPAEIGKMTSLEKLWLSNNQLSGDIPSEIANLTSLDWLDLNSNTELTGELPAGLRLLPVTVLDIRNTCITTPADSDFQAWLLGIDFRYTDRVCVAAGVTVTPTALSVPEGSSAKYTVVLDAQPSADVTISLSFASGSDVDITLDEIPLTFTTENWDTAQEVTVSAAEDDDALNGSATIEHTASGGGYGGVTISSVTATEEDNDMAGVTVTPTALTVAEGDSVQYTVVLDTKPSADVTITVSLASDSDEDITVSAGSLVFTPETWSTAQDVWIKAAEDDDAINGSATIDHAVSGGDYAGVTASSVTATEADNDTAGVTVTPVALTVAEGDSVKYTVVLDTKPSGDVTIAVSPASGSDEDITVNTPSLTFTTDNWDAAQEITVLAEEDDDALNGVATIEHSASGGDYGSVSVSSVVATEEDNDTAGVTVTPTALSVTEGSSEKYTVVLDTKPSADVTIAVSLAAGSDADITVNEIPLTFTTDNWSTAQEITVSAEEDTDAVNGVATIEHAVSGSDYNNVTASSVTVTESDNDAAGVTVNPTALTVGEGDNVKYTVVLTTRPSADVTISASLASGSDADITVDKTSLTFTPDNWNAAQEVTVSAAEDDDAINGSATIEHSVSGGDYANVTASSVTATEADNDAVGVTVTPTALSVPEGSSAKYTVVLDAQPSADVTISVSLASGSDTDITVDKTSLTFTTDNWDAAQEVTVSAAEDDDALNGAATIEHTASGGDYGSVSVSSVVATEEDNDTAGVTVTPTALAITEGSSEKYAVVLDTQPSADVTIMVSLVAGSDADITVDKTSLTFTTDNWNVAREVTVSAAEDTDTENGAATIEHSASGGGYGGVSVSSVTVTESDNDAAGVTVTPTALAVVEGDSVKYTVVLTTEPSNNVTISVSLAAGSDADITVDKTSLTFTTDNWDAAQEITVLAAEDDDALNGVATIEHSASGANYGSVSVSSVTATEADNDAAGVTVTPTALTVPEGSNAKYTVVLDTQPSADVTISVSFASGSDEDITVDKTSLTFTPDNWNAAQEITVLAAEDDDAINGAATIEHTASGGRYSGVTVSSVTAIEADNDTAGVTVTPTVLTVTEGSNAKYTVVLDTQPSGDVTISVSFASGSDEDITVDKTSLTFTPDNWSMAQEVTVTAAVDNDTNDDAAVLNHKASGGDYGEVTIAAVVVTVTDVIGGVDVSGWLARYSRVGAGHLLSSVENRMERLDRTSSGAEVSVAGQRIVFGDSPARPGMELSGASAIWSASQSYTTSSLDGGRSVGLMKPFGMTSGLNAAARRYTNMTLRDALSRSAFRYAREMSSGNSFGVWGQGSFSRFSGSESGADMDGDVMSGTVGIDNSFSGWLHGIAVSRSESEGAYRIAGEDSLSLSASLTGIYPYMRYNLTDRLRVWGTGGFGRGSLRLQGDSLASSSSDLSMALGSIGVSGDIVSAGSQGFGLSWQTDAMLLRSSLASSRSLSSVEAIVHRLRLSLESSYTLKMGDRASFAPKLQLGVRRDGGDAEQGMGLDVAGGLGFIHSGWGLRAQVDMHGMVVHEDSDFEEWGVSGMILFDRSPSSELGMSLRLIPSWGSASSSMGGMRALWSRETVSGLAGFRRTGGDDRSLRLDSRFDYGFAAFGEHGVTAPYASFSVSGNEAARAAGDTDVEIGGGLGYSNRSLGLRMQAGVRGLMSDEAMAFDRWGASGVVAFDPDPSSPLGASFNVSPSWGIAPVSGFGSSQNMGGMRQREPLPRSVTGMSRPNLYGQPMRIEGEMGYGFSASGGKGVATPYAGVAFSDRDRSGLLLGFNLQAGRRFLLNVEGSTPKVRAISFDSMPEFRVRGLLKW